MCVCSVHSFWSRRSPYAAPPNPPQVMAFFVTARLTQFYAEFMGAMGAPVLEIHSRKSQSARTKAADAFRNGSRVGHFGGPGATEGL